MSIDKFYALVAQRECDDPYYPPYNDVLRYYRTKEQAIEGARRCRKRTKEYSSPRDCYYVEEHIFSCHDNDNEADASSNDDDNKNNENEDDKAWKEEIKKYNYYGEDEELFFDENHDNYKKGKMVYVIGRKLLSDKNKKK